MADWLIICIGVMGTLLCVCLFALNDFDFDKTMFKEDEK